MKKFIAIVALAAAPVLFAQEKLSEVSKDQIKVERERKMNDAHAKKAELKTKKVVVEKKKANKTKASAQEVEARKAERAKKIQAEKVSSLKQLEK